MSKLTELQATLWPPSPYDTRLMIAGAAGKARTAYGTQDGMIVDFGALRQNNVTVEIFMPPGQWEAWADTSSQRHLANAYNVIGPGHSYGNNGAHAPGPDCYEKVNGVKPDPYMNMVIQYSSDQTRKWCDIAYPVTDPPDDPPVVIPPVDPPVDPEEPPVEPPVTDNCSIPMPPEFPFPTSRQSTAAYEATRWWAIGKGRHARLVELAQYMEDLQDFSEAYAMWIAANEDSFD